jgi:hypothetical protein
MRPLKVLSYQHLDEGLTRHAEPLGLSVQRVNHPDRIVSIDSLQ